MPLQPWPIATPHPPKRLNKSAPEKRFKKPQLRLRDILGPGLITGASDDDPSGIATYSQAGAQFGYGLGWTMIFTYPLMSAVQMISARIGRVTGHGIAGNLRRHYPAWLANLAGRAAADRQHHQHRRRPGAMARRDGAGDRPAGGQLSCSLFAVFCAAAEVFMRYQAMSRVLKWLTLALLSLCGHIVPGRMSPGRSGARGLVMPKVALDADDLDP